MIRTSPLMTFYISTVKELTMGHAAEISVFVSILIVNLIVMYCINQVQQSPYMDEIFHIRQAKHYCHGNFTVVRKSCLIRRYTDVFIYGKKLGLCFEVTLLYPRVHCRDDVMNPPG